MAASAKTTGSILGTLLGLGAPFGSLILKAFYFHDFSVRWLLNEILNHDYYYFYMMTLTPLVFGGFGFYLGALNDKIWLQNKSLESLTNTLQMQSMTDDVTGLYNHRHLLEEIEKEIERTKRHVRHLSGIMIDMDDFKEINDLYGHLTGDRVLREMALVLIQSIRKIDILGRYGGDEFVIILPEADLNATKVVATRILKNIQQHRFQTTRDYIPVTASLGIFSFKDIPNLDKNVFIEKIDETMFKAKALGKNKIYSSD